MEAGLTSVLASENLTNQELYQALLPYYLSIGMTDDSYWNGAPELVLDYFRKELISARKIQRQLWTLGIYIQRAIASCLSDSAYPPKPFPSTTQEAEEQRADEQARAQKLIEARFAAWGEDTASKGG